ncbi:hypothetical protein Pmar_PMAR009593 [Perkinsus marinus ATCC 50983]|uniref:Uncharacterized protein n=1 Tax=Perkinsus marinus (strain ATCC 50983 / TXsc) TaxID=423536 RepID=C5M0L1_PERM5|nr:hypothetical protein Pmar_PMAR009593 [Perkinsus marinus ATCC 50983]EEQ97479.1 hypothetical protein Pmar_PMAR009593 [Perkinsus marinus ATCC 50983]|eukprot:XP_002764762.1 hypothetical protein Pmar_PMAR009593 [Perkinsus marinus ATCC 50983]
MSDHPKISSKTVSDLTTSPNDLEHIINYLRRTRPSDLNLIHAVEEGVRHEALLGRALGPLLPDIALQAPSFCSPIFAIHQSNKIRLISNYAFRSHGVRLNDTAEVYHKVSMPRLSHIALVAQALGSGTKHL